MTYFNPKSNKILKQIWLNFMRSRYFLIPENKNIPSGDFLLFNLIGKKKKVALTAITSFEITEEEANIHIEKELKKLFEQIKISEDSLEEIPKMLEEIFSESNIEKYLPDFVNKLGQVEDKIADNPELLQQSIYEFYTSLSEYFFKEREKRLEEKRQQEIENSAKEAVKKALSSFNVPTFADTEWMPEIDLSINEDDRKT